MKKGVVLLSGGLDSTTAYFVARHKGYRTFCLIFDYGQRHRREIEAAKKVCRLTKSPYYVVKISLPWKGSSLLDKALTIPMDRKGSNIPSTYVPGRNTIFLSFALSYAEAIGSRDIFIGANALDYSGYPDCRPRYYHAFNRLAHLATKAGVEHKKITVHAPLIHFKKSEIIRLGVKLGVPYGLTWSCYQGSQKPCGRCDSCVLRAKGFREAGLEDPSIHR